MRMTGRMRLLRQLFVTVVLVLTGYTGFTNADDIVNTATIPQRLVGVTATLGGIAAVVALYGYWVRVSWLARVLWVWAALAVFTVMLAAIVYGGFRAANLIVLLVAVLLVGAVVVASRERER